MWSLLLRYFRQSKYAFLSENVVTILSMFTFHRCCYVDPILEIVTEWLKALQKISLCSIPKTLNLQHFTFLVNKNRV